MISVMIVDDDPFVSGSLKIILDNEPDIEVKAVANSGEEAVKLAPQVAPDVIVMDIRMEGMNGTEAAQKILENGSKAAVLFLTTFLDDEYINKALKLHPLREKKQVRQTYMMARPYMERYRRLAPQQKQKWGPALYRIYLNLNMGKQFDEIDRLLKQ